MKIEWKVANPLSSWKIGKDTYFNMAPCYASLGNEIKSSWLNTKKPVHLFVKYATHLPTELLEKFIREVPGELIWFPKILGDADEFLKTRIIEVPDASSVCWRDLLTTLMVVRNITEKPQIVSVWYHLRTRKKYPNTLATYIKAHKTRLVGSYQSIMSDGHTVCGTVLKEKQIPDNYKPSYSAVYGTKTIRDFDETPWVPHNTNGFFPIPEAK